MGNIFKCCGKTGKPSVRIIGYIDIVLSIVVLMGWILSSSYIPKYLIPAPAPSTTGIQKHESTPNIVGMIILIAIFFLECCLLNMILSAVKNKNPDLCDNWIKIRILLLSIFIFALLYWITRTKESIVVFLGSGIGLAYIFYRIYSLFVVKHFQNEISPKDILKLPLEIPMQVIKIQKPQHLQSSASS